MARTGTFSSRTGAAVLLAAGSLSSVAHAQSWASSLSGPWFDPAMWNPMAVPTGPGATAVLGLAGAYDVATPTNTLSGVVISNPLARLLVNGGSGLTLVGTSTVDGQIVVNGSADYAATTLTLAGPVQMNGSGRLFLNSSPGDPATTSGTAAINASGNGWLVLGAGFQLGGFGSVNAVPFTSLGTVNAGVTGRPLIFNGAAQHNNGLFTATNGGSLVFNGAFILQGVAGSIAPGANSTVTLHDTPVDRGSITSEGTGRVRVTGVSFFNDVVIHSGVDLAGGSTTSVYGVGLVLDNAVVLVNAEGDYAGTSLRVGSPGTLFDGIGTVRLNASPGDSSTMAGTAVLAEDGGEAAGTFTFASGVKVAGFGLINNVPTLVNGLLVADIDGRPLRIEGSVHQNNGSYAALGGGHLYLNGVTLNQAPGASVSSLGAGPSGPSSVQFVGCTVTGGQLGSNGASQIYLSGATHLNSLQLLSGQINAEPAATVDLHGTYLTLLSGTTIMVNRTGDYSGTSLRTDEPFSFTGQGAVRLNASPGDSTATAGTAYLGRSAAAGAFLFSPGDSLEGFGMISDVPTTNYGTFSADVPGRPLRFQGNYHTNFGTYRAINGGQLVFNGASIIQTDTAQILIGDGSSATFTAASLAGGTLGSPPGGTGTVTLDSTTHLLQNVTVSRQLALGGGGLLTTPGLALSNGAQITLNPAGDYAGTAMVATGAPTVLSGSGVIHLRASSGDSAATAGTADLRRDSGVPGSGFTFNAGVTVDGFGQINNCPTTNNGVVEANIPGRPIRFSNSTHQNNGAYRAVNGASLVFAGTVVTQSGGGSMTFADGTEVHLFASDISGGAIAAEGSARCRVDTSSTLRGLTSGIPIDIPGGQFLTVAAPGVTSNGLITVNSGADYAGTYLNIDGAGAALGGTGGVLLRHSNGDLATTAGTADLRGTPGSSLVMGSGQSLTGGGRLTLPVTMNGIVSPGVGPGGIDLFRVESGAALTMSNTTQTRIELASGSTFDRIDNSGTVTVDGTLAVTALPGFSPSPGTTIDIVSGTGTISGQFDAVDSSGLQSSRRFGVRYDIPGKVRVTVLCGPADIAGQGADGNGDGVLNNNDFIVYIDRFFANDPRADLGGQGGVAGADGQFNNNDFIVFIDLFFAGCF